MTKVIEWFPLKKRVGEVGIEIEVEAGEHRTPMIENTYWFTGGDGSLRGNSAEYILKNPVKRKEIPKVLNNLKKLWKEQDVRFIKSVRTSTHVHINMQQQEFKEVISFFVLYSIFEDLFVKFCGREREGNLFCLRGRDAGFLIEHLVGISTNGNWNSLSDNNIRYASVNMAALAKFGSMEFRAMRGTSDFSQIKLWINMLLRLKDNALAYDNPRNILELFSQTGEHRFLEEIMGDYSEILQCPKMGRLIREGVWRVQELAFTPVKDVTKKKRKGLNLEELTYNDLTPQMLRSLHLTEREQNQLVHDLYQQEIERVRARDREHRGIPLDDIGRSGQVQEARVQRPSNTISFTATDATTSSPYDWNTAFIRRSAPDPSTEEGTEE